MSSSGVPIRLAEMTFPNPIGSCEKFSKAGFGCACAGVTADGGVGDRSAFVGVVVMLLPLK